MEPYQSFIGIAIGFSWLGFISIFAAEPNLRLWYVIQSTFATSIFLCSIGLAFSHGSVAAGSALVVGGLTIAFLLRGCISLNWSTLIAAVSFAAYLHGFEF